MSGALSIIITLVELAAVAGFYAATGIIMRYAIHQAPYSPDFAKRFHIIYTVLYALVVALALYIAKQSLIPLLGILIWVFFNYGILVDSDNPVVRLVDKFQEIAVYIIVGVITTVVAWAVFYVLSLFLDSSNGFLLTVNTILNWTAGVLVAYPMNRHWVFHSKNSQIGKEFIGFVSSRIATLIIEELIMLLCVNLLHINQYVSKYIIASIAVIILNYVFSKLFIFKKKKEEK